jgi:hypothetical protein
VIAIVIGIGLIAFGRRRNMTPEAPDWSAPPLYAPPTVRSIQSLWPATLVIAAVVATVFLALALAVRS